MDNFIKIQEIVDKLLEAGYGDRFKATYTPLSDTEIKIDINGDEASYLIGQHGKTLLALQHIIRQIYIHETEDYEEKIKIIIDVDDYKQKRIERIKDMTASTAEKCLSLGKEISLPSMTPFERHIVHEHIQENFPNISTSSVGEEPNRRVVLRPTLN